MDTSILSIIAVCFAGISTTVSGYLVWKKKKRTEDAALERTDYLAHLKEENLKKDLLAEKQQDLYEQTVKAHTDLAESMKIVASSHEAVAKELVTEMRANSRAIIDGACRYKVEPG